MSGDVTKIKTIPCYVYYDDISLGYTDAPVEFAAEVIKKEVTADQKGEEVLVEIIQGNNLTISTTLKEFDRAKIDKFYKDSGLATEFTDGACSIDPETNTTEALCTDNSGTWTPGTPVLGFGSATTGLNLATMAKQLKLVPIDTDEADNIVVFWKASPTPGSLNYSGVDETMLEIEWRAVEDTTKPAAISKAFIGNPTDLPNYFTEA